jgi:hypothetical protein
MPRKKLSAIEFMSDAEDSASYETKREIRCTQSTSLESCQAMEAYLSAGILYTSTGSADSVGRKRTAIRYLEVAIGATS